MHKEMSGSHDTPFAAEREKINRNLQGVEGAFVHSPALRVLSAGKHSLSEGMD